MTGVQTCALPISVDWLLTGDGEQSLNLKYEYGRDITIRELQDFVRRYKNGYFYINFIPRNIAENMEMRNKFIEWMESIGLTYLGQEGDDRVLDVQKALELPVEKLRELCSRLSTIEAADILANEVSEDRRPL